MDKFKGIFPALLTPFDKENKINEKALEKLIEMNLKKGVKAFTSAVRRRRLFFFRTAKESIYISL